MRRNTGAVSGIGGALLAFAALLPLSAAAQTAKIGYVDLKRVLDEAPQMIESRARLEREFSSRDGAIKAAEAKLTALKQRYERDSVIMSKDDAEALKREIDATERANKRMVDEARSELATRQAAERDRNWQKMQDIIIEFARSQGYDLIEASPPLYVSPRIDITDAVLDHLKHASSSPRSKP
ncbi:MAG TPA: OmpH family outer membrane protein [Rudaea sp.]